MEIGDRGVTRELRHAEGTAPLAVVAVVRHEPS